MLNFSLSTLIVVLLLPAIAHSDVTFADSEFDPSDWELTTITYETGGDCSWYQEPTDGNPGSFGEITIHAYATGSGPQGGACGFFHNINALYDPASEGAIQSIGHSQDARYDSSEIWGSNGHYTGPALRQDGIIYVSTVYNITPETTWTAKNLVGLTANDFLKPLDWHYGTVDPQHPDFSETGSPIELGFYRWAGRGPNEPDGRIHIVGIDNWNLTVINGHSSVPSMNWYGITTILLLMITAAIVVTRRCKTGAVT